jgi:hypothetical protein
MTAILDTPSNSIPSQGTGVRLATCSISSTTWQDGGCSFEAARNRGNSGEARADAASLPAPGAAARIRPQGAKAARAMGALHLTLERGGKRHGASTWSAAHAHCCPHGTAMLRAPCRHLGAAVSPVPPRRARLRCRCVCGCVPAPSPPSTRGVRGAVCCAGGPELRRPKGLAPAARVPTNVRPPHHHSSHSSPSRRRRDGPLTSLHACCVCWRRAAGISRHSHPCLTPSGI